MCWFINKTEFEDNPNQYHKVAEEDIFVYKIGDVIDNEFHPKIYNKFAYKPEVLNEDISLLFNEYSIYEKNSTNSRPYGYNINNGYHSYSGECSICDNYFIYGGYRIVDIKLSTLINNTFNTPYIGKFIIPKGTEYYENDKGEIVSSQIMWTGKFGGPYPKTENGLHKLKDIKLYVLENRQ